MFHVVQCVEEDDTTEAVKRKMIVPEEGYTRNEDVSNNDHCVCDGLV